MTQDSGFRGKRVFVSGGTGGVGFAAAKQFAAGGARLAVSGRNAERGQQAVADLLGRGAASCMFLQGDSGVPEDMRRVTAEAAAGMGGIDSVVSAGAENDNGLRVFEEASPDYIRATIETLVYPRLYPVHAAIPHLKQAGAGSIVMICTDAARHPTPGEALVGGTGAMIMLVTKALAREQSRNRIRVNAVAMTITSDTPGWERAFRSPLGEKVFTKAVARFPFGRAPNADEVASVIAFLSSDAAAQVSGQILSVNGGLSFGGW